MKLTVLLARWKLRFQSLSRIRQRLSLAVCIVLPLILLAAGLGTCRLSMLVSGNPGIYSNLPVLWNNDPLKVHIIDVGQGDATLIQYCDRALLIDTGPPESSLSLSRYLKDLGLSRLDLLILTHPHDDHVGAAMEILREFSVHRIFLAHSDCENPLQIQVQQFAKERGIPVSSPFRDTHLTIGELSMTCLHPMDRPYANINNYSSVWELTLGRQKFLFLADLEEDEFASLTTGSVDFLRAGHHGSQTSLNEDLLRRLSPSLAGISVGEGNPFGHPSKAVLQMLKASETPYFRTDQDGTVVLSGDGKFLRRVH